MTRKDTAKNKLAELFGLTEVKEETEKIAKARQGNIQGVTEEEIETLREFEAIVYFLQAPILFHPRVCKRCGTPFMVSRLHVAFCSLQCIQNDLWEKHGIKWRHSLDREAMVNMAFDGNEPLWIRNVSTLQAALEKLLSLPEANDALLRQSMSLAEKFGPPPIAETKTISSEVSTPTPKVKTKKKLSFS